MAEIKPFRALRYTDKAGELSTLACPPYDIIGEEERLAFLARNQRNVIRLELPRGERPYEEAGETLKNWLEDGTLKQDSAPAIYIYEEEFTVGDEQKRIRGVICRVRIEEFSKGVVLPHEETLSKAKTDRFNLMKATFCNFSQIYSLYMDEKGETAARLDALAADPPRYEFSDGTVTHRLWVVNDLAAIGAVCADFADRKLYIADGHHRYETALNFRDWCRAEGISKEGGAPDYVMMMLVNMQENDGLVVFPTHRLVRGLPKFDAAALLAGCEAYFTVEHRGGLTSLQAELDELYAQGKNAFACYMGGEGWVLLTLKDLSVMRTLLPEKSAASQGLDVTILHTLVLERVLGIDAENMAQQINLTYTRDFDEAVASVRAGQSQCAFLLNPTRVEEIRDVAAAGEKMPQKSTYFYPKLITGLVMNSLREE